MSCLRAVIASEPVLTRTLAVSSPFTIMPVAPMWVGATGPRKCITCWPFSEPVTHARPPRPSTASPVLSIVIR
jgi:hypothetical protein